MAWEFIIAIYKSGWDRLIANDKNRTFKQYILSSFNKITTLTLKLMKGKGKQADISRIPLFRPSKSILTKSKFFKNI